MVIVRTFSKSEDAYLVASFLESEGIEAVVVEDGAYGGNALGATKNSIRVEVAEESVEAAKGILREFDGEDVVEEVVDESDVEEEGVEVRWFRRLLIVDLVVLALLMLKLHVFPMEVPYEVSGWIDQMWMLDETAQSLGTVYWAVLLMNLAAIAMMAAFMRLGRVVFAFVLGYYLFSYLLVPPAMVGPVDSFLSYAMNLLDGAILMMAFYGPVAARFRGRVMG